MNLAVLFWVLNTTFKCFARSKVFDSTYGDQLLTSECDNVVFLQQWVEVANSGMMRVPNPNKK